MGLQSFAREILFLGACGGALGVGFESWKLGFASWALALSSWADSFSSWALDLLPWALALSSWAVESLARADGFDSWMLSSLPRAEHTPAWEFCSHGFQIFWTPLWRFSTPLPFKHKSCQERSNCFLDSLL